MLSSFIQWRSEVTKETHAKFIMCKVLVLSYSFCSLQSRTYLVESKDEETNSDYNQSTFMNHWKLQTHFKWQFLVFFFGKHGWVTQW